MEVVVTTGAIRRAKLLSNRHHQQTNTQFLQTGDPFCHSTNGVREHHYVIKSAAFTTSYAKQQQTGSEYKVTRCTNH